MFNVGKWYVCGEGEEQFRFKVKKVSGNEITITYGNGKSCTVGAGELELCHPRLSEEATDSGNVMKGTKVDYSKIVKPQMVGKKKNKLLESLGFEEQVAVLSEDAEVVYNTKTKVATLYECEREVSKCKCTRTDWNLSTGSVCSYLGGLVDESD